MCTEQALNAAVTFDLGNDPRYLVLKTRSRALPNAADIEVATRQGISGRDVKLLVLDAVRVLSP
jgi:hypothetical protein